ncbi:snRNA-activating protein complex subunit 3, putative [Plasmodium gallinaceum]|uniref:snRNA-activating protein complex subunit 3, putative n=1 Tax=Plasmodium gallinaceum TaxID=5849 RepID=A0A1J1GQI4_PLAGA|nr:snRNA-activating protein complex subunit 3, putative [Plasmodium gallinaceum]CRG94805.1 snRNA-activating protein complex subunit 3, putative [Plasmodium gallinaceum]
MDENKSCSFQFSIPHFSVNFLFEKDQYDFYKIKYKENIKDDSNIEQGNILNETNCSSESENEKLFMKYLKNIVRKGNSVINISENELNEEENDLNEDTYYLNYTSEKHKEKENLPTVNKIENIENETIKKDIHLFEKYPDISIKDELKNEWIYHKVATNFNVIKVNLKDFKKECDKIKERLKINYYKTEKEFHEKKELEKSDKNEEYLEIEKVGAKSNYINIEKKRKKKNKNKSESKKRKKDEYEKIKINFYNYLIKILLSGIRTPNVDEIINHIVYYNCNNWQQKIDLNILKKVADDSKKTKVLNRTKCFLDWLPKTEDNTFSKYQIVSKLKNKTLSKTFKLVCDFNNSILKALYINQNLINSFYTEKKYQLYTSSLRNLSSNDIFVISVSFYHPIRGIKIAEYEILSNQTLANLTDVFFCFDSSNYGLPKFEGSVYFIDGILYPDLRSENALDYSKCILDFYIKKKDTNFIRYPYKINQDKAILNEIEIPLFQKCCFLHQGNCEHRIVFNNIRQYNSFRDKEFSKYPLRIFKPNTSTRYCMCCHKNIAEKIVLDCYLLKENPSYICNNCFSLFLLDTNNKPIDNFMKYFDYINDI